MGEDGRDETVLARASILLPADEPLPVFLPDGDETDLDRHAVQSFDGDEMLGVGAVDESSSVAIMRPSQLSDPEPIMTTSVKDALILPAYKRNEAYLGYKKFQENVRKSSNDVDSDETFRNDLYVDSSSTIIGPSPYIDSSDRVFLDDMADSSHEYAPLPMFAGAHTNNSDGEASAANGRSNDVYDRLCEAMSSTKENNEYANCLPPTNLTATDSIESDMRKSRLSKADDSWLHRDDQEEEPEPPKVVPRPRISKLDKKTVGNIERGLALAKPEAMKRTKQSEAFERSTIGRASITMVKLEGDIVSTALCHGCVKMKMFYAEQRRSIVKPIWLEVFAVLLEDKLLHIFKDEKQARKRPDERLKSISLIDAHFSFHDRSKGLNYTKKSNVLMILTRNFALYLMECNSKKDVQRWQAALVESNVKQMPIIEHPAVQIKRHRDTIFRRLRNFFTSRPSYEDVRRKGYFKDLVFGADLTNLAHSENEQIPSFVKCCIKAIEDKGLDSDGLYRINGNMATVQKLRHQVDHRMPTLNYSKEDIHVLTGALKMFFRELKSPLISHDVFHDLVKAFEMNESVVERVKTRRSFQSGSSHRRSSLPSNLAADESSNFNEKVKKILRRLPIIHYEVLKYLLAHLNRVYERTADNKMTLESLSICFSPNLMTQEIFDNGTIEYHTAIAKRILQELLKNSSLYFPS